MARGGSGLKHGSAPSAAASPSPLALIHPWARSDLGVLEGKNASGCHRLVGFDGASARYRRGHFAANLAEIAHNEALGT